jgi:hypothetical protein
MGTPTLEKSCIGKSLNKYMYNILKKRIQGHFQFMKLKKTSLAATMVRWFEGGVNQGQLPMIISEEEGNLFCACHSGFLKLVVWAPGTYASQLRTSTCHMSVVHRAYTPNDLLLAFIKDL